MLRPRVLASVLQEANENSPGAVSGDCCTLLLNREGALLAASSHQNTGQQPRVIAAIVSTVWSMASQNVTALDRDPLQILILDSSKARIGLTCVGNAGSLLLCMYCGTKSDKGELPPLGMIRKKIAAVKKHLDEPLSQIATAVV